MPRPLLPRLPRAGLALAAFLVALVAGTGAVLAHLRFDTLDAQQRELGLLSAALGQELDRGLQGAVEGMQAMQDELRSGRLATTGPDADAALKTRADLMPLVRTLWLVDADGTPTAASDATPLPALDAFTPALATLAAGDDAPLAFGRPYLDPRTQTELVVLAMRAPRADGGAAGWILAGVPTALVTGAFSLVTWAPDARMVVSTRDGTRLAGDPSSPAPAPAGAMATSASASASTTAPARLAATLTLPHYPLTVQVSRDPAAVLTAWRETARFTAGGLLLVIAVTLAAAHLVVRADRRHRQAQAALAAQLARSSKLESLGTLAGGVAHDFNNLLAAIIGFGEMAADAAAPGSAQARHLDKVLQAAARGKALVERILTFSRGGGRTAVTFALAPVVDEVLGMLAASLRPGLVLQREVEAADGTLRGDPTQAFEAVMNLCTNAMQAMPDGGTITVALSREVVGTERVLSHGVLRPGRYLVLSVADEGPGIAPDVLERLFEPFFTTRRAQSGTGLGLAVVHGVVAELHGAIDVQTRAGQGSRFVLHLPESGESAAATAASSASPAGRGQSVLVLDDEPALVALMQEMLAGLGYRPTGFGDPRQALDALRADPAAFDAVITDELMPGMNGTDFTAALRQVAPALPVLMVSGYGGAMLASRAMAAGVDRLLTKPLARGELARALADLLR